MADNDKIDWCPPNGDLDVAHIEHKRTDSRMPESPLSEYGINAARHRGHQRTGSDSTEPPYAEHGPVIDRSMTAEAKKKSHPNLTWPRMRHYLREPFSEFLGTFVLIMFGDGVVAQVVLSNGTKGDYQSISWGWGLGVMLGV